MLDQKHVTFYARSSRVPLNVAERDVVLTYALKILSDTVLPKLAFKGGTCLKKTIFGSSGRFSMDLDFTNSGMELDELTKGLHSILDQNSLYDISFKVSEENVSKGFCGESYLAVIHYEHSWNTSDFTLEVSYRENPMLPPEEVTLSEEMYFRFLEFPSFGVTCLQKEELLAEKLRAAFQRIRGRDLYDLYLFSKKPFDKDLVRKLVVVKCWNARESFVPERLLNKISTEEYDWADLERLVRKGDLPSREALLEKVTREYAFLKDLDKDLIRIVKDGKAHGERKLVARVLDTGRNEAA
jgi:predicted nucleotidyltransferase component of viral defense system